VIRPVPPPVETGTKGPRPTGREAPTADSSREKPTSCARDEIITRY
jgi:hypothetical protein